jgi:fructoselysine-6-P-deglycase FrlB-like protein
MADASSFPRDTEPTVSTSPLAPSRPRAVRRSSAEERKVDEVFERYGRTDVSAASARAFADGNPRLADGLGITTDELAALNTESITLEEAVRHGLFEPIDDDPLALLRKT